MRSPVAPKSTSASARRSVMDARGRWGCDGGARAMEAESRPPLRPAHQPKLERVRKVRMAGICPDPVVEAPAQVGREIDRIALLAVVARRSLRGQRVAMLLIAVRIAFRARHTQLDPE